MAIFHFQVNVIGRGKGHHHGRNVVRAAAYQSGSKLYDERLNRTFDFSGKDGVVLSEIRAPRDAPASLREREALWNAVEMIEKRKDAQIAREVIFAIPNELSREQGIAAARHFVHQGFVSRGMIADFAVHDEPGNLHAHVLLTTREVGANGFGNKVREWDRRHQLIRWRQEWEEVANYRLERAGREERIDHRRYTEQGIDREPMLHESRAVREMEDRLVQTRVHAANQAIIERNNEREWDYGR